MKTTIQQKVNHEALSLISNITYAQVPGWFGVSGRDLRMSVICPKIVPGHEKLPVVLWICGGAYLDVDENVWMPQMVHLARRGFVVASAQYRTSNQAAWPAPLTDVKSAVRYLRANAERYAIDPKRVYVMGESAGGTFATLCSVTNGDRTYDEGDNLEYSSKVQKAVDFYGLVDFHAFDALANEVPGYDDPMVKDFLGLEHGIRPACAIIAYGLSDFRIVMAKPDHPTAEMWYGFMKSYFGGNEITDELLDELSPYLHVTEHTPPMFIWATAGDQAVPNAHSLKLAVALDAKKVPYELHIFEEGRHGLALATQESAGGIDQIRPDVAPWLALADTWLKKRLAADFTDEIVGL